MSKKNKITLAVLIIIFILAIIYLVVINSNKELNRSDALKFKEEYESINTQKDEEGNYKYKSLSISDNNNVKYSDANEVIDVLKNGGTAVIYFGFPECPWCRTMISPFLDVASEFKNNKILYFNAKPIRDTKHLDENGNIITDKEGTEEYKEIVSLLYDYLGPYEGLNDNTVKRLYFPTVVFVKSGEVIGIHIGTVDSQEDVKVPLDDNQLNELKQIFRDNFNKLNETDSSDTSSCDDSKKC